MLHPISTAIREARKSQGLTLAQVGESAGVSRGYVSGLEVGQDNPIPKGIEAVLGALSLRIVVIPEHHTPQTGITDLFIPEHQPSPTTPAERADTGYLCGYQRATTTNQTEVLTPGTGILMGTLHRYALHRIPDALAELDERHGTARANAATTRRMVQVIVTERDGTQHPRPAWAYIHQGKTRTTPTRTSTPTPVPQRNEAMLGAERDGSDTLETDMGVG